MLSVVAAETHEYVKAMTAASKERERRVQRSKKLAATYARDHDSDEEDDMFADGADEAFASGGPAQSWSFRGMNTSAGEPTPGKMNRKKFILPEYSSMRVRSVIHERATQLISLRCQSLYKQLKGLNTPGKFVLLESGWLDDLLLSFSACDDWATLLKSSKSFRS